MKNRFVAAILAFVLGGFGIHKFYLGEIGAGLCFLFFGPATLVLAGILGVMGLASPVVGFLAVGTVVPTLLGWLDCLVFLGMSDRFFDARYNAKALGPANNPYLLGSPPALALPSGGRSASDITRALADLQKLYKNGALTPEEYEEKRRKLLQEL